MKRLHPSWFISLSIILVLFLLLPFVGQSQEWVVQTIGSDYKICAYKNFIWIGTGSSGLLQINKINGKRVFFSTANSDIPSNYFNSIVVDDAGNVWLGTNIGLAKFDGTHWYVYSTTNSNIPTDDVDVLAIEDGYILWLTCGKSLPVRFDILTETFDKQTELQNCQISGMAIDSKGRKWISTFFNGIAVFDDVNWVSYKWNNSDIPNERINCIAIDQHDHVWAGTIGGLIKFDGKEWSRHGLLLYEVRSIAVDHANNIWYSVLGGLSKYDGVVDRRYTNEDHPLPGYTAAAITVDDDNHIWACMSSFGTYRFDGNAWSRESTSKSPLLSDNITSIAIDSNNVSWVGTRNGLHSYDGTKWSIYTEWNSPLPDNWIRSVVIDKIGHKWIGTTNGLAKIKNDQWTVYTTFDAGLPRERILTVNAIAFDSKSNVIIGTHQGVFKLENEMWLDYASSNAQLSKSEIMSVAITKNDIQWVGTSQAGLFTYDGAAWQNFTTGNSILESNWIHTLFPDNDGSIWIGTGWINTEGGLYHVDGLSWKVYNTDNSPLIENFVYSFLKEDNGDLWIGGYNGLVHRYGNNWEYFDIYNSGLPVGWVSSIAIDSLGNKWIGTTNGLAIYNANGVTSIPLEHNAIPHQMALEQNYPNPFNSTTMIHYTLANETNAQLFIYNTLGQKICTLVNAKQFAGQQSVLWNGLNDAGKKVASGVYLYQLRAGELIETRKMVLMP